MKPRISTIPADAIRYADIAYVVYPDEAKPRAKVWIGRAKKTTYHYCFRSISEMELFINEEKGKAAKRFDEKNKSKALVEAARKSCPNPYKLGQIFVCSWGYDQTNIDFYEAVAVTKRQVTVRKIAQKAEPVLPMIASVLPCPGHFTGEPMKRTVSISCWNGETVHYGINFTVWGSSHFMELWNGKPKTQTSYA